MEPGGVTIYVWVIIFSAASGLGKSIRLSAVFGAATGWRRIMIWSGMQVKSCWRQRNPGG